MLETGLVGILIRRCRVLEKRTCGAGGAGGDLRNITMSRLQIAKLERLNDDSGDDAQLLLRPIPFIEWHLLTIQFSTTANMSSASYLGNMDGVALITGAASGIGSCTARVSAAATLSRQLGGDEIISGLCCTRYKAGATRLEHGRPAEAGART